MQNEATGKEITALKSVIRVIEQRKLDSEYPKEILEKRIEQLEKQKAERKGPSAVPAFKPTHLQHQLSKEMQNQQSGNKRPRLEANFVPSANPTIFRAANTTLPSYQQSHLQSTGLSPDGLAQYVSSSAAPYGFSGLVPSAAAYAGSSAGTYGLAGAPVGFPGDRSATSSHLYAAETYLPSGYYDRPTSYGGAGPSGYSLPPQYHPSYYPQ